MKAGSSSFKTAGRLFLIITVLPVIIAGCDLDTFFIRVAHIEGVPETGEAGKPLTLTGTIRPAFASNKDIVWSVLDAGTTGAEITGNILNTAADGIVAIRAIIANGITGGKDYTQDFIIYIEEGEKPVIPDTYYNITFESNGGSTPTKQIIKEGGYAQRPDNPTRAGHNFVDWYDNEELTEPSYDFNLPVTGDITLYAKWNLNIYIVTFDSRGGNEITSQTVGAGGRINKPADPYKSGYNFDDWYEEEAYINKWDFDVNTVTGDITLYAKWTAVYTIIFNTNGGNEIQSQTVTEGGKVNKPTDPYKSGFNFSGWYREGTFNNKWDFNDNTVTGNIILYAKWTAVYMVTFNANGGNTPASQSVEAGGYAVRPSDPVKAGFSFDNWYSNSGLTTVYNFGSPVTGNITLYAKWVELISGISIEVTGPAKGETPDTAAVVTAGAEDGDSYTVSAVSWSPDDSLFKGNTHYTAAVTVTAKTGSKFTDSLTAEINGHRAEISGKTDTSVTISYMFAETLAKMIKNISINSQPAKLTYTHGNTLNLSGLSVKLTYDDETTEIVALADFENKTISTDPANGDLLSYSTHNNQPVKVSIGRHDAYTNNLTLGKATPTITFPTAAPITYGEKLSQSALTGESSTPSGSFKWENSEIEPDVKNNGFNVEFSPLRSEDKENYDYSSGEWVWNSVTGKAVKIVQITVNKAAGWDVGTPVVESYASLSVTVAALGSPGSGQSVEYAINTANTAPSSGWQDGRTFSGLTAETTYFILARSKTNDNYNAGTPSVSIPIVFYIVTFKVDDGSTVAVQNIRSGGKIAAAPTPPSGYVYDGWYKEAAFINKWDFNADTVDESITLFAKRQLRYSFTSFTFEQISEQAPSLTIPTISRSGASGRSKTAEVTVSNPAQYGSITWSIPAYGVTKTGSSITLDSMNFMIGKHYITLEVYKNNVPYSRTIAFEVVK